MKVLFYLGEEITNSTKMIKGEINTDNKPFVLTSDDDKVVLDPIIRAEKAKIPGGGTALKITLSTQTIYMIVPRIYVEKGDGFVIVNTSKTNKLYALLTASN